MELPIAPWPALNRLSFYGQVADLLTDHANHSTRPVQVFDEKPELGRSLTTLIYHVGALTKLDSWKVRRFVRIAARFAARPLRVPNNKAGHTNRKVYCNLM